VLRGITGASRPKEALCALLGSKASCYYLEDPAIEDTYNFGLLSLPDSAGQCCLAEVLEGPELHDVCEFKERFMLSEPELAERIRVEVKAKLGVIGLLSLKTPVRLMFSLFGS
jgi:hypothetical protein